MTEAELYEAFRNKTPVYGKSITAGTHRYDYINAVILKHDSKGNEILCGELMDKHGNCVVDYRAENISMAE